MKSIKKLIAVTCLVLLLIAPVAVFSDDEMKDNPAAEKSDTQQNVTQDTQPAQPPSPPADEQSPAGTPDK